MNAPLSTSSKPSRALRTSRRRPVAVAASAAALGYLALCWGGQAHAGQKTTCVNLTVLTNDSGFPITVGPDAGQTETYLTGCGGNTAGPCTITADHTEVMVLYGNSQYGTYYTNENGCFTWWMEEPEPRELAWELRIRTIAGQTNQPGYRVRVHNGSVDDFSVSPGDNYAMTKVIQAPSGAEYVTFQHSSSYWVTFAMLMKARKRWIHSNYQGDEIHVAMDTTSNCFSSSAWGSSTSYYSQGRAYLRLQRQVAGGCTGFDDSRSKFVIAHELGHTIARLWYGLNGNEPQAGEVTNNTTPYAAICQIGGGVHPGSYGMHTKEWNVIGFKEGIAHFGMAYSWNAYASTGAVRWTRNNATFSLEHYDGGAGSNVGGHLKNNCCTSGCTTSWAGAGTNEDWMRHFWDFFTNNSISCPGTPTRWEILGIYKKLRQNGGLTRSNYWTKSRSAAQSVISGCLGSTVYDAYGALNGVDTHL